MTWSFSPGKLITFVLATILGGLLQLWVLWLILASVSQPPSYGDLLGDGGLFFFATSLFATSLLTLVDQYSLRPGSADFNITLVSVLSVIVPAVAVYASVLTSNLGNPSPFSGHVASQLSCASAAFAYAGYVAVRTGQLHKKRTRPRRGT